jgi:hypothetical protein
MNKRHLNREVLILLCIPGIVGLFLPVTDGESPLNAVRWIPAMAGPFFLSIIILAWQIQRFFRPTSSAIEVGLAFMFGLGATVLLPLIFFVSDMISGTFPPEGGIEGDDIIYFIPYVLFYGPPIVLAGWCLVKRTTRQVAPGVFLFAAYLPNAILSFLLALDFGFQAGAYVVLLSCISYVAGIILLLHSVLGKAAS